MASILYCTTSDGLMQVESHSPLECFLKCTIAVGYVFEIYVKNEYKKRGKNSI